ncbi:related to cutinase precursor [Rhynchosporium secalis]|uniref:cutinase n=1 Tax=Rhynchosporium secalis TaxID=38038 RepID=A0A1E1MHL9_RHYSE|nr:related to cutinase precursor [Rhynchosporium secalis]
MWSPACLVLLALPFALALPQRGGKPKSAAAGAGAAGAAAAGCKPMMVVFARGTTETGTLGTIVGPPYMAAMEKVAGAGNVAMLGVPYPADVPGFLAGGDKKGSAMMAAMVMQTMANCPDSSVSMSGYSQGSQLVHNAAALMPPAVAAKMSSAVLFGDPMNGKPVAGVSKAKTKVICHTGDLICAGTSTILAPHLTYGRDAPDAAAFAVGAAGK